MVPCPRVTTYLSKVYFTVDAATTDQKPLWAFNDRLRDSQWKRYPFKVAHPLQVPPELRGYAVVLVRTGEAEDVIMGALRAGVFLTLQNLKSLQAEFHYKIPGKGCGSGKKGNVIKADHATALLKFFFGDKASEAEHSHMFSHLMGRAFDRNGVGSKHASHIIEAFQALDVQDQPAFSDLVAVAADELRLKEARAARAERVDAKHASPLHETPPVLHSLLPTATGSEFNCRVNRHPVLQRFQCFIDCDSGLVSGIATI